MCPGCAGRLLRRLRAIALVHPGLEHREIRHLTRLELGRDPAALTEPVGRGLGERHEQRHRARAGQLARDGERIALHAQVGERLVVHRQVEVTRPGEVISNFTLREQEQNEWLQVLSIDPQNGTVNAILKRPVVRIRNAGAEVVLSFKVHGKKVF